MKLKNKYERRYFMPPFPCMDWAQKEYVDNWKQLVESIMIDWNYDGVVMEPTTIDIAPKDGFVEGVYTVPADAGRIKVKITDLLSESLEIEVE